MRGMVRMSLMQLSLVAEGLDVQDVWVHQKSPTSPPGSSRTSSEGAVEPAGCALDHGSTGLDSTKAAPGLG